MRIIELDKDLQRKAQQLGYKQDGIDTLQVTLNQYREKCRVMEEELTRQTKDAREYKTSLGEKEFQYLGCDQEIAISNLKVQNA